MDKDEILTTYLNIAPFGRNHKGQNIAGAQQAAEGIFGVNASGFNGPSSCLYRRDCHRVQSVILLMNLMVV